MVTWFSAGEINCPSVMTVQVHVVHQFAKALEMRQQVDVIYLDFSKAFD